MQLGETYFKRSWAERAPGPPANSGDYEDGQALPHAGRVPKAGLKKLSVRQTGSRRAPPDLSVPAGKQDPAPGGLAVPGDRTLVGPNCVPA